VLFLAVTAAVRILFYIAFVRVCASRRVVRGNKRKWKLLWTMHKKNAMMTSEISENLDTL